MCVAAGGSVCDTKDGKKDEFMTCDLFNCIKKPREKLLWLKVNDISVDVR